MSVFFVVQRHPSDVQNFKFPMHFRCNVRSKKNSKNFYCTKSFALKFEGESWGSNLESELIQAVKIAKNTLLDKKVQKTTQLLKWPEYYMGHVIWLNSKVKSLYKNVQSNAATPVPSQAMIYLSNQCSIRASSYFFS